MKTLAIAAFFLTTSIIGCNRPTPSEAISASDIGEQTDAASITLSPHDWPGWRGPEHSGISTTSIAPTRWSPTENIIWKTQVPGLGHSSPVVVGDQIVITTADEQKQTQAILAFDRRTGDPLWNINAHTGGLMKKHQKNSHASATLASDGQLFFAPFINDGALHVTSVDLGGKIVWQTNVGSFTSEHGYGSAPVLHKSLVIVNGDSLDGSFVAALHRDTGKIVWRTPRESTGKHGSYATPIVANLAGRDQLLLTGMNRTTSYDPATGKLLWSAPGPAEVTGNTPAVSDSLVFTSGGYPEKEILAIRADSEGDLSDSHIAWRANRGVTYVPSPLYAGGLLYVVSDNGIATCFDAESGDQVWQERLVGAFTASPLLAGDKLYITNEAGLTFVLRTGREFEILAENDIGERTLTSPAVSNGQLFLRTERHLYGIGESTTEVGEK